MDISSTREDMLDYIEAHSLKTNPKSMTAKKHKAFMEVLKTKTAFLDDQFIKVPNHVRLNCYLQGYESIPVCNHEDCNNLVNIDRRKGKVFTEYCSYVCSKTADEVRKKISNTNRSSSVVERKRERTQKHYQHLARERGYDNPESYTHSSHFPDVIDKRRQTMAEHWDNGHPMKDNAFVEERKGQITEKWGVDNPMKIESVYKKANITDDGQWYVQTQAFNDKRTQTMKERYNVDHPMHIPSVREKQIATNKGRYNRSIHTQKHISKESLAVLNDRDYLKEMTDKMFLSEIAEKLNVHQSSVQRACGALDIPVWKSISKAEKEIKNILDAHGIVSQSNIRLTNNMEVDIYVPEHSIAIEYNGMYWHSEAFKYNDYHQKKSLAYQAIGITIVHVWEDDWLDKQKKPIIINKILSKLGINEKTYARKTSVDFINRKEAMPFYNANHIQGHVDGSVYVGLRNNQGDVVACMTMKDLGKGVWDLSRYATSQSVVGGLSKCLAHFKRSCEWHEIFTFASLDYSNGRLYERTGFTRQNVTSPNMWYMKVGEWVRLGRRRFIKHRLPNILDSYDELLSEKDNMRNNGYTIIHDAGSIKYTMTNSPS